MKNRFFATIFTLLIINSIFLIPSLAETQTGSLYFTPNNILAKKGDTVVLTLNVDTHTERINVISTEVIFPQNQLEYLKLDLSNSIFPGITEEKEIQPGMINIFQYVTSGDTIALRGNVAKIYFKLKQNSYSEVKISSNSTLLNRDTKNILSNTNSAYISSTFLINDFLPKTGTTVDNSELEAKKNFWILPAVSILIIFWILGVILAFKNFKKRKIENKY